jgi:CPA2 family monovalent cation:H+ antiporter-2
VSSFALAITSLTMLVIPILAIAARHYARLVEKPKELPPEAGVPPTPQVKHAIVIGYGRVGRVVCSMLREHGVPYTATDNDVIAVSQDRRKGHDVSFGDATDPAFLKTCGLMAASGVIITIHNQANIDEIVRIVREVRPDILIVSRARDADHARRLYAIGVTDAVPETIEASLQLSEAALVGLGIPAGPVIASIHDQRDGFRRELQDAAQQAGRPTTHSVRPKSDVLHSKASDTAA